ncbi:hypothetical protein Syun_007122 [Stephania yunnanensis]|uniref:Uncharacterized protein n=1 Tax=Stephania yunnanensis TaxID=152371 RepID=A0AAP0Q238_9MAGN
MIQDLIQSDHPFNGAPMALLDFLSPTPPTSARDCCSFLVMSETSSANLRLHFLRECSSNRLALSVDSMVSLQPAANEQARQREDWRLPLS